MGDTKVIVCDNGTGVCLLILSRLIIVNWTGAEFSLVLLVDFFFLISLSSAVLLALTSPTPPSPPLLVAPSSVLRRRSRVSRSRYRFVSLSLPLSPLSIIPLKTGIGPCVRI